MPAPALKFNKLFNVYNTTLRMLQDRGCTILGPKPVVEALAANPTGPTPISPALLKKLSRPDEEDAKLGGLTINRAALTITCTLSTYVLQLTNTLNTPSQDAPLMQVVFVEEENNLASSTVHNLRDAARNAGAQWLTIVADAKVSSVVKKEADELNVGWALLTTSGGANKAAAAGTGVNSIISEIVEKNVAGLEIPAGAKPRRAAKKSTAAATDASATATLHAFVDENQPIAALAAAVNIPSDDSDDDNAAADSDKKKKSKKDAAAAKKPRPLFVELFEEDDLVFSPMRHSLAPKHRVLTEAETEALLREKGATLPQLPRMEFVDPIARYFGLQRGAVVHITRAPQSDVVGEHSMYRHVV